MKIEINRITPKDYPYTIGVAFIDDIYFCDILEPQDRGLTQDMSLEEIKAIKVYGETAIPTGEYDVIVDYSPKFKRELPRIQNVKGFDGVLFHRGNKVEDTLACLITGENKEIGKVINSTPYELELTKRIKEAGGAKLIIE